MRFHEIRKGQFSFADFKLLFWAIGALVKAKQNKQKTMKNCSVKKNVDLYW